MRKVVWLGNWECLKRVRFVIVLESATEKIQPLGAKSELSVYDELL